MKYSLVQDLNLARQIFISKDDNSYATWLHSIISEKLKSNNEPRRHVEEILPTVIFVFFGGETEVFKSYEPREKENTFKAKKQDLVNLPSTEKRKCW